MPETYCQRFQRLKSMSVWYWPLTHFCALVIAGYSTEPSAAVTAARPEFVVRAWNSSLRAPQVRIRRSFQRKLFKATLCDSSSCWLRPEPSKMLYVVVTFTSLKLLVG